MSIVDELTKMARAAGEGDKVIVMDPKAAKMVRVEWPCPAYVSKKAPENTIYLYSLKNFKEIEEELECVPYEEVVK